MKNFFKILAFYLLSMLFVSDATADEWAKQDCLEYEQMIGGLVWLSGETLEMSDKARKAEKEEEAKELFDASFALSQMASNHTNVYAQFCD
ncbi:MAG: hypothetical protein CBC72_002650 [Gammaproteobacteria bacterium TMED112]|mgnify:CR=1 FL=1|nr:MAG: hypothetical protein CBC72_002650 [Gammaproteobacteria bacterium TMED112]|tara:strand:- start:6188 stop:6460 length:273 start_codon:yes stop_codon:yes gene_type:complete